MDGIIAFVAQYLYFLVILGALIFLAVGYRSQLVRLGIATVVIGTVAYLLSKIGTALINDPRPFLQTGKPPLISSATDNGFPSDHTLLVATVAAIVGLADRRAGMVVWVLALLIGLARVYSGVHHLLDVAGSFLIVIIATSVYLAAKRGWDNFNRSKTESSSEGASPTPKIRS